ncbi:hypothetical protein FOZ63_027082 [Perkinsus olseni]|uniref:Uncharacterized protein n=1 Tax=Perkinsus olseni TaxID=32597 RepID=A0A7J6NBZ6_PEROL|nr:hypothetical protein FOZ60_012125 [Perkinsus olseni]KAF4719242.1 hypothetical protein FOZ63_027082 [Perkinsus olseni]KAF4731626.1 hypothetical protein FOZ62_027326 [Perkinsus olseni]
MVRGRGCRDKSLARPLLVLIQDDLAFPGVWREGSIHAKRVDFIRDLEESSRHVLRGTKSVAICFEEQPIKDAREDGKRSKSVNVMNMSLEPFVRESRVRLPSLMPSLTGCNGRIIELLMMMDGPYRVRADSEQSRDVHACELVRPAVIIPELTIQGYDRTLRAVAGSEAALLVEVLQPDRTGLDGSLGIPSIPKGLMPTHSSWLATREGEMSYDLGIQYQRVLQCNASDHHVVSEPPSIFRNALPVLNSRGDPFR